MHRELRHSYSLSFANMSENQRLAKTGRTEASASTCKFCTDVLLLSFWVAVIPAVLWIGSAAGF